MVDKLETLKDFHMQKSTLSNLSEWRFAVLIAMANPLEYFLKYRGNLILAENALQVGCKFTKVKGGSMVMACLWELHEISIWSGSTVATAQLPWSRYMAYEPLPFVRDILQFVSIILSFLRKGEVKHHPELCIWYSAFFKLQKCPLASVHAMNSYSEGMVA